MADLTDPNGADGAKELDAGATSGAAARREAAHTAAAAAAGATASVKANAAAKAAAAQQVAIASPTAKEKKSRAKQATAPKASKQKKIRAPQTLGARMAGMLGLQAEIPLQDEEAVLTARFPLKCRFANRSLFLHPPQMSENSVLGFGGFT